MDPGLGFLLGVGIGLVILLLMIEYSDPTGWW